MSTVQGELASSVTLKTIGALMSLDTKLQAERDEQERMEASRLAAIKREDQRIEADRLARQYEAERLAQAAEMKPDVEKLHQFAKSLRWIAYPVMATNAGERMFDRVRQDIATIADYCEDFVGC